MMKTIDLTPGQRTAMLVALLESARSVATRENLSVIFRLSRLRDCQEILEIVGYKGSEVKDLIEAIEEGH
jgi:hypothetical protein